MAEDTEEEAAVEEDTEEEEVDMWTRGETIHL